MGPYRVAEMDTVPLVTRGKLARSSRDPAAGQPHPSLRVDSVDGTLVEQVHVAVEGDRPVQVVLAQEDAADGVRPLAVGAQLRELLTQYGPLAGIWLDPIMGYYARPDLFPIEETYTLIRSLQPQTLIAFKQGANGDEDFASPERSGHSLADRVRELTDGMLADYVFVATGAPSALASASGLVGTMGAIVIVGMPATGVTATTWSR